MKKPDFSNLDLSKITGNTSQTIKTTSETQVSIPKKKSEGTWIDGIDIKDITPDEFREWLHRILPSMGVDKWDLSLMKTPEQRERLVSRVTEVFTYITGMLTTVPVKNNWNYN